MSTKISPKVYMVARTIPCEDIDAYLEEIGAHEYRQTFYTGSGLEIITEVMAKMCYRSFEPGLNANVTKTRIDRTDYIGHILASGHGSVLEHASISFIFHNVSRVFTHELVRHRAGCAISQESLRFVRLTDLKYFLPSCFNDVPEATAIVQETIDLLEIKQRDLAELLELDDLPFSKKKELTSAMRRIAPIGLATTIGWTANIRALRHVIRMRTELGAEEEIRLVFGEVFRQVKDICPNLFQDAEMDENGVVHFQYPKV